MASNKIETNGPECRALKQKRDQNEASAPVRVKPKTKARLEQLLRQANKDRIGRKIRPDDLLWYGLGLITETHLAEICSTTLSNKDRMELLYRRVLRDKRGTSREEFLGMLLDGKLNVAVSDGETGSSGF